MCEFVLVGGCVGDVEMGKEGGQEVNLQVDGVEEVNKGGTEGHSKQNTSREMARGEGGVLIKRGWGQ